jgi:glycogen debranching enzyme
MTRDSLLARQAKGVLRGNDAGAFTKPGPHQYPHQWNWDSALIALGLSHFDLPRAQAEIRALLSGQWRDGMLPHVIYHDSATDYFPGPAFWQIEGSRNAPGVATTGITQPPLLATIVRMIHERTPVRDFVREVYGPLLGWHRWLHTARDIDGSGIPCLIHPWESGTDDSPRWLHAMAAITPKDVPPYGRGDTRHVAAAERPYQADYDRFVHLIDVFRRLRYEPQALLARSPFLVQDVLFSSILYRADQDLRALGLELGQPVDEITGWLEQVRGHFDARFWDERAGLYFDYDRRAGAPIRVGTATTFLPLYAGLADAGQARRLVEVHMENPSEYAPGEIIRYRLTTTSLGEPTWDGRRYWRGPVWIILNWLVADGLRRYGYDDLADTLVRDSLTLLTLSGFREYYDPRDGAGLGSTAFSWSAALALEFLDHV